MQLSLTRKILLVVAIPLLIQLIFIVIMVNVLGKLAAAQNLAQHYVKVVMARDRFIINERQRTMLIGVYLATLDQASKHKYFETRADTAAVFAELEKLWKDDPERTKLLNDMWEMNSMRNMMTQRMLGMMAQKETVSELLGGFSGHAVQLRKMLLLKKIPYLDPLFTADQEMKAQLDADVDQNIKLIYATLWFGLVPLVLASLLSGLLFSVSVSRRLKIVLSNIGGLANNQVSMTDVRGGDEISALNGAIVSTVTKIREAEEFQAQTIAIIAEELNKPLTEVDAALQGLVKHGFETLSEKGSKRLHDSTAEVKRLESLVFELVNLDAVGRKFDIVQVDLAEMSATCAKIVEPLTKLKSISIVLRTDENSIAFADGDKITQVLINFLSNAIKYSPEKSEIDVDVRRTGSLVKISVRDHGPGISEQFYSRIFKRFEQVESAGATKSGSSGLGLTISKEIVESQGGEIGFISAAGEGSTFWFSLPTQDKSDQIKSVEPKAAKQGWKSTLWKRALLIVSLPIIVQSVTAIALFNFLEQNSQKLEELQKIPQISSLHEKLMTGISRAGLYAMMYNVDRSNYNLAATRVEAAELQKNLAELEKLTASKKSITSAADKMTEKFIAAIQAHVQLENHLIKAKQNADVSQFVGARGSEKKENLLIDTRESLQDLARQQDELIASNALESEKIRRSLEQVLYASAIAASIVAASLAAITATSLTSRAKRLADAAEQFSIRRELPAIPAGDDELAFVGKNLHAAAQKLTELEMQRTEMVGVTSHELRTPLASLIALIEVMEARVFGELTHQGEKLLAKARLECSELIILITNLLDLEKMESGKILVSKQLISVESVFEQIKTDNELSADNRGINLIVQDCQQEILGDSNRLNQALTAVIRSLLERIPSRSKVSIECKNTEDRVVLAIAAPHGVAVKSFSSKHREFARERMAISLARLTVVQHGGELQLTTTSKGRRIELCLPVGV